MNLKEQFKRIGGYRLSEASRDDLVGGSSEPTGETGATSEDPKDVAKLVDKLKNNQGIRLAVQKINLKNEVGPAIIAFAALLNDQVPGALTSGKRQQIIKAMKEME